MGASRTLAAWLLAIVLVCVPARAQEPAPVEVTAPFGPAPQAPTPEAS
jgi:hypothetical protein